MCRRRNGYFNCAAKVFATTEFTFIYAMQRCCMCTLILLYIIVSRHYCLESSVASTERWETSSSGWVVIYIPQRCQAKCLASFAAVERTTHASSRRHSRALSSGSTTAAKTTTWIRKTWVSEWGTNSPLSLSCQRLRDHRKLPLWWISPSPG